MSILISALVLGFMGSFHCAGMCGPIAIALPLQGNTVPGKILGGTLYNLGRTITYGIMGAIFGLLGQGVAMIGFQQKDFGHHGKPDDYVGAFPRPFQEPVQPGKKLVLLCGKT